MTKLPDIEAPDRGSGLSGAAVGDPGHLQQEEIDHRIANSLQLVATILNHERRQIEDAAGRAALERAQARLMAISRMHRQLSRTRADCIVDLAEFLAPFCRELEDSLDTRLDMVVHDVRVHADAATQICIVLNELTANAVKHARPDGKPVCIIVRAAQDMLGNVYIMLRDNGQGLPAGFDMKASGGLGMAIVRSIVEKLDGRICIMLRDGKPGAGFEMVLRGRKVRPAGRDGNGEARPSRQAADA